MEPRQLLSSSLTLGAISGPASLNENDVGYYEFVGATQSPATITCVAIGWGDGSSVETHCFASQTTSIDESYCHCYGSVSADAKYTISATVYDSDNDSDTQTLDVTVADQVPTLDSISGPSSVNENETCCWGFSASVGGVDTICCMTIAWGDGGTDTYCFTSNSVSESYCHTYGSVSADTQREITAIVYDTDGDSACQTLGVTVVDQVPTLYPVSGPTCVNEGDQSCYTFSASVGGVDTIACMTVAWGDASSDTYYFTCASSSVEESYCHTYADGDADYHMTATVYDSDGDSAQQGLDVHVANVAPTINVSPTCVTAGQSTDFAFSVSDPGPDTVLQYVLFWGDGSSESYNGATACLSHTYDGFFNQYMMTVSAVDEDGAYAASVAVTIGGGSPAVDIAYPTGIVEDQPFTIPVLADARVAQYVASWGDGTTATIAGQTRALTHTYKQHSPTGGYAVQIVAYDQNSNYSISSPNLTVAESAPAAALGEHSYSVERNALFTLPFASSDPGRDITCYAVCWGDGTSETYDGGAQSAEHIYNDIYFYCFSYSTVSVSVSASGEDGTYTVDGSPFTLAVAGAAGSSSAGSALQLPVRLHRQQWQLRALLERLGRRLGDQRGRHRARLGQRHFVVHHPRRPRPQRRKLVRRVRRQWLRQRHVHRLLRSRVRGTPEYPNRLRHLIHRANTMGQLRR